MMGATFPAEPIRPGFHRHTNDLERYVRLEYGENDPTWLVQELDGVVRDEPAVRHRPAKRSGFSLRALAAKIASILF